ncbi:hypothetical protein F4781DRAFT_215652 [Annulohypoxylon bovei var. microspora]|nr:hypothetical protein F4781DRAFT_215652 [Annulohypoxylon bovei var. microspora]
MRSSSLVALALALCGAVIAAPAPTGTITPAPTGVVAAAAEDTPDCAALQHYCESCSGDDFNCETDPNCEWCRAHNAWDPTTSTTTSMWTSSTGKPMVHTRS